MGAGHGRLETDPLHTLRPRWALSLDESVMIITFWDHETGRWAIGDSIFDGRMLPASEDDHRFWAQKEALLGQGECGTGTYLSITDMKKAKNVLPCNAGVWTRSQERPVICPCGRTVLKTDVQKRCVTCRGCRAAKRKLRRRGP